MKNTVLHLFKMKYRKSSNRNGLLFFFFIDFVTGKDLTLVFR
jgi:hypothetical protein